MLIAGYHLEGYDIYGGVWWLFISIINIQYYISRRVEYMTNLSFIVED